MQQCTTSPFCIKKHTVASGKQRALLQIEYDGKLLNNVNQTSVQLEANVLTNMTFQFVQQHPEEPFLAAWIGLQGIVKESLHIWVNCEQLQSNLSHWQKQGAKQCHSPLGGRHGRERYCDCPANINWTARLA